ncbi:MAG: pantetheine-phosphate adenylyltransferase [Candidatus Tokpelaia sp. JSC189]|nr:MAG: pantetheine-phosphate adenylyltransferase [Candidatus Tokpelaia sp. JSC189]
MGYVAIYAGSFDPITNGHVDVLRAGFNIAEKIVVAIGLHVGKIPLFTFEERAELIRIVAEELLGKKAARVEVIAFDNLLVEKAREIGASFLIRSLRDGTDLDYEMQLAGMNSAMAPDIQTVFLPASVSARAITATLVRQIASMKGDVSPFVPKIVMQTLNKKFNY